MGLPKRETAEAHIPSILGIRLGLQDSRIDATLFTSPESFRDWPSLE